MRFESFHLLYLFNYCLSPVWRRSSFTTHLYANAISHHNKKVYNIDT